MSKRPALRADIEIRELDDSETVLYDPQSDAVHVLNRTAALIVNLCDGEHSTEEMATKLGEQFEVEAGVDLLADVEETLTSLKNHGLLQP
jgi:PqqD family protein of HPr-rel-A system